MPTDGRLIYRGIDVRDIVNAAYEEDRFIFEEVIWLLLFGSLPTEAQLKEFKEILEESRSLPENFVEDMACPVYAEPRGPWRPNAGG